MKIMKNMNPAINSENPTSKNSRHTFHSNNCEKHAFYINHNFFDF